MLESAADCALLAGVWKKTGSALLAVVLVLVVATAPLDMARTATIWNPSLSVALVKVTLALLLLAPSRPSIGWAVATTAAWWLAVQAHATAIFIAAPAIGAFVLLEVPARNWKGALQRARASIEVVLLLQVPFFLHLSLGGSREPFGPTAVIAEVSSTAAAPETIRVAGAFAAVASATDFILFRPWHLWGASVVLLVPLALAAYRCRHDILLASAGVLPVLAATLGYALWQSAYDHYWFLTLMPPMVLVLGSSLTVWPRAIPAVGAALLVAAVVAKPWRLADARGFARFPAYAALVRGSTQIYHYTAEVTDIRVEFPLDPTTDREFLHAILGGRVTPDAPFRAAIAASGDVTFTAVPQP